MCGNPDAPEVGAAHDGGVERTSGQLGKAVHLENLQSGAVGEYDFGQNHGRKCMLAGDLPVVVDKQVPQPTGVLGDGLQPSRPLGCRAPEFKQVQITGGAQEGVHEPLHVVRHVEQLHHVLRTDELENVGFERERQHTRGRQLETIVLRCVMHGLTFVGWSRHLDATE